MKPILIEQVSFNTNNTNVIHYERKSNIMLYY